MKKKMNNFRMYWKRGSFMASTTIKVIDAVKKYGNNIIIPKLNLLVKPGEFFTLLGQAVVEKQPYLE